MFPNSIGTAGLVQLEIVNRMCGISLIVSGVQLHSSSSDHINGFQDASFGSLLQKEKWVSEAFYPTMNDLKEVNKHRGPDHVGTEKLQLKVFNVHEPDCREGEHTLKREEKPHLLEEISYKSSLKEKLETFMQETSSSEIQTVYAEKIKKESGCQEHINICSDCSCSTHQASKNCIVANFVEEVNGQLVDDFQENTFAEMLFLGATLQLRGVHQVFQPLRDLWTNVLVYNGEIFGGIFVGKEDNDTKVLMDALQRCCSCPCHASRRDCFSCDREDHISVPQLLSKIKGPWALIYWQAKSKILWFGRDAFGRRSLLVHWPSLKDSRLLLSSVAPFQSDKKGGNGRNEHGGAQYQSDNYILVNEADGTDDLEYWDELACGIYSISLEATKRSGCKDSSLMLVGRVEKHGWSNPQLKKLLDWKRSLVEPGSNDSIIRKFNHCHPDINSICRKENGLTSSVTEIKSAKLGYQEFCNSDQVKGRVAVKDGKDDGKMICRDSLRQLTIDEGLQSKAIQQSKTMDFISLNSVLEQNNAKVQVSLGLADSQIPFSSDMSGFVAISGDIQIDSSSTHATGSQQMASEILQDSSICSVQHVLFALKQAVMRRTCQSQCHKTMEDEERIVKCAPIAILFSGGLDSMILAALLDQCLTPNCEIDLLNVSFDGPHAPDRISAKAGVIELQRIAPLRRWRLVEIDADPSNLQLETKYLTSIIHPSKTYMDLNIGTALWLAACGEGWVEEDELLQGEDDCCLYDSHSLSTRHKRFTRKKYRSEAKILLVGSGADEQCAGYGRHRTKFRLGGWVALQEEMKIDIQRIWKRNLGRDDRCIADHGKEARFPFLDEDVISTLLDIPLWEIADLEKPAGQGDKKILRKVAQLLGLYGASTIPKRAIQFGSRIARESNRRNFGSNRAANQASAGSTLIHCLRE